jgi:hypothetical protein
MNRRQKRRLLILLCGISLLWLFGGLWYRPWTHGKSKAASPESPKRSLVGTTTRAPPHANATSGVVAQTLTPQGFSHRLRCTQYRQMAGHQLAPDVLAMLCSGKTLDAVKRLSSLAAAGDRHALAGLALLGNVGGSCDAGKPSPTFSRYAELALARAREHGATSVALERLSAVLAEEQAGPSDDDLEACRQSALEFKQLVPATPQLTASGLGLVLLPQGTTDNTDAQIDFDRRTLSAGDPEGQLKLAFHLLQKGTPDNQAEALGLLRQAADALPAAKTELAQCLLTGCPAPAADATEGRQLLMDAARAGDWGALAMLSGMTDPQVFDAASILPLPDQYAWSQLYQRLSEAGCFGTAMYVMWVDSPRRGPNPMAMSPADSANAEAAAASLLATRLDTTRAQLGCN